jgi:osmoprotectant transport system substrate-binding protein
MRSKLRLRFSGLPLGAMLLCLLLLAAACGDDDDDTGGSPTTGGDEKPSITVGAKDFASAQVVSQIYGQALAAEGYDVSFKDLGPTETTFAALESGDIDLYGEYQGTLLAFLEGSPTADADETNSALQAALPDGIVASGASPAVDVNGFYVTQATADQYDLTTISDLKAVAGELVFGGPQECEERPLCLGDASQELYGLEFKEVKKLDTGGPITTDALANGDIQVGLLFTGSSVIEDDFVLLEDDQGLQPADNVIAVWRDSIDSSDLAAVIDAVNAALTTEEYNRLSLEVFNEQRDPDEVASDWLEDQGLV